MDLSDVDALPIGEKLRLVERLWDAIGAETASLPATALRLTPEQRAEIDRRRAEAAADPSCLVTEEEMWRRFRERHDR